MEPLRFRKSSFTGAQSNCVEIAHTLRHIRDSKKPHGGTLSNVDVPRLVEAVRNRLR